MSRALDGLRVVELAGLAAGPYCGRLLAGLGADVVKVEPPEGDPARWIGPFPPSGAHPERSALFLFLNQGKRSVRLDLHRASDRHHLRDLLRHADVLIESLAPVEAERMQLSYGLLAAANPRLIATSIQGSGTSGDPGANEMMVAARGGLMYLTGDPEREPLRPPGWQASYLAGAAAAIGTLAALRQRHLTGQGQQVSCSLLQAIASTLEGTVTAAAMGEQPRRRRGQRLRAGYPLMLLPCRDGHVVLTIANDADWESFTYLVGDARLREPRFASPEAREQHADELQTILEQWLTGLDRQEFFAATQERRFPCAMVVEPAELFQDAHHVARRFFAQIDHPLAGPLRYPGPPFQMPSSPWPFARAPLLGEHDQALSELRASVTQSECEIADQAGEVGDSSGSPSSRSKREAARTGGALGGVRVLDLTSMWAGPLCTRILADAGAEVIKIELAERPDGTRRSARLSRGAEPAPFFAELNRNKLGVTLDLRTAPDRERFCALVKTSDVVVENFSPRVMGNLGLDYEALRELRPDLIMLSMPAFGLTGPWRDAVAFGSGIEAMSGFAALTGYADGPPALLGVAYGDPVAGLHGAVAILAALEQRRRTGQGQHVELAQRDTLTQMIGETILGLDMGIAPERHGNRDARRAPHGCYPCLGDDRWIVISVADDGEWRQLSGLIGEHLAAYERFASLAGRLRSNDLLDRAIADWTRRHERRDAARLLRAAGVTAAEVLDASDLAADEELLARELLLPVSGVLQPGFVCRLSANPSVTSSKASLLGEHNVLLAQLLTRRAANA